MVRLLHWVTEVALGHPTVIPLPPPPPPSWCAATLCAAKQLQVMSHQVTKVELRGQGDRRTPTGIHLPMPAQNQTNAHNTSPRATHSRSAAVTQPVAQPNYVAAFTGIAGSGAALMFMKTTLPHLYLPGFLTLPVTIIPQRSQSGPAG
jgi:hypothetical protein